MLIFRVGIFLQNTKRASAERHEGAACEAYARRLIVLVQRPVFPLDPAVFHLSPYAPFNESMNLS